MQIAIRVDAHEKIALGHLRRCFSLAYGLLEAGVVPIFLTYQDNETINQLEKTDFKYHLLPNKINDGDDLRQTCDVLRKLVLTRVIIDSYDVDDDYIQEIRNEAKKIIYLDDMYANLHVDVVINGAIDGDEKPYHAPLKLVGSEYIILNRDYWGGQPVKSSEINRVLVTMGGIDHYNLSSRVLPILEKYKPGLEVNIVAGPYYDNIGDITAISETLNLDVIVHRNPNGLHSLMQHNDMAISAGGFTLYELAATGTPTVGMCLWENQRANVEGLAKEGALLPLYYSERACFDDELSKAIETIFMEPLLREQMSLRGRKLIDGCGAIRVGSKLSEEFERSESGSE